MGRRGPAPEPAAIKRAKGVTAPSRMNYAEPIPRQGQPEMPADMTAEAKAVWQHVVREMPVGVIVAVDAMALRCYCEAVERYRQSVRAYHHGGAMPVVKATGRDDRGVVRNPLMQVIRDNADQVRAWARELGLTPSARANLRMLDIKPGAGIAAELGPPPRLRAVT